MLGALGIISLTVHMLSRRTTTWGSCRERSRLSFASVCAGKLWVPFPLKGDIDIGIHIDVGLDVDSEMAVSTYVGGPFNGV